MIVSNAASSYKLEKKPTFAFFRSYFWELCRLCFPLMLSAFSGTLMVFIDRIVLGKYDTQAMISAISAYNACLVFQLGAMSIAMIAEVFVGRLNGAKQWQHLGKPVWQMIWFSLMCAIVFIPIGIYGQDWFIPDEIAREGKPYFLWMMIFSFSFPLVIALSAFFIGQKKVKMVTLTFLAGNFLNILLVILFVFGFEPFISPQGARGAAFATGISQLAIVFWLLMAFLNRHHRQTYHTHDWKVDKTLLMQCIKVGLPNALGQISATTAWSISLYLSTKQSYEHITVLSITFSIWAFFTFITKGLQTGVATLAANAIGAKNNQVSNILKNGLILQFILALLLFVPMVLKPHLLMDHFIPLEGEASTSTAHLIELTEMSCLWLWIGFVFDGLAWVIDGILTAMKDTRFIMLMNAIGTWVFCIGPIYLFVFKMHGSPVLTLQLISLFYLILFSSYYFRYRSLNLKIS